MKYRKHILNWDTQFFSFLVQKIDLQQFSRDDLPVLESVTRADKVQLSYIFAPDKSEVDLSCLKEQNFFYDQKLGYEMEVGNQTNRFISTSEHIFSTVRETEDLYSLALSAGAFSRFKLDPRIPVGKFEALYRNWLKNSIEGHNADMVFQFVFADKPVGFLTLKFDGQRAIIGLIAVDQRNQSQGVGRELITKAIESCMERGIKTLCVYTQEVNSVAKVFYEKVGFSLISRDHIFHAWNSVQ